MSDLDDRRFRRALRRDDGEGDGGIFATIFVVVFGAAAAVMAFSDGWWRVPGTLLLIGLALFHAWVDLDGLAGAADLGRTLVRPIERPYVRDIFRRIKQINDLHGRLTLAGLMLIAGLYCTYAIVRDALE